MEIEVNGNDLRMTHPKTGDSMDETSPDIVMPFKSQHQSQHQSQSQSQSQSSAGSCGGGNNSSGGSSNNGMVQHHHNHNHSHASSQSQSQINRRLFPVTLEKRGHYGYAVEWADGATVIYSMSSIAKAASKSHLIK